jgi:hypothetical protein
MAVHIHFHHVNMVKGLSAGLSNNHNIYHFSTVLHQKICEKYNKSVHHTLCEDWVIFELTLCQYVRIKFTFFWNVTTCGLVSGFQYFGRMCYFHLQGQGYLYLPIKLHVPHHGSNAKRPMYISRICSFARTSCYVGKESCEEWMTCQKTAVLIYKTVRTLICTQ